MIVAGPLAYLEMPKTGCTHIAMLLRSLCGGRGVGAKHSRLPESLRADVRFIVGSIRNPWDWYVSLWAFGCGGQGALYRQLTDSQNPAPTPSAREWRDTYVDDPQGFRAWLRLLHDPARREEIGEYYADSPISWTAGLMTYRYSYLHFADLSDLYAPPIAAPERLQMLIARDRQDFTIHTERLEIDLVRTLHCCGFVLDAEQLSYVYSVEKTNASTRQSAAGYYDDETRELVGTRDRFLIDHYGYAFPESSPDA
jgi:hypothetical protein